MGVAFGGCAVRGPSGMSYSHVTRNRHRAQNRFELGNLPCSLPDLDSVTVHDGDTSCVISPVFEAPVPLNEERARAFVTDVADYSTHAISLWFGKFLIERTLSLMAPNLEAGSMPGYAETRTGGKPVRDRLPARVSGSTN